MKKILIFTAFGFIILTQFLTAQIIFKKPLSPRNASYKMKVTLDTEKKQIHGTEILLWRNITHNPTSELQFHLYMNAFKNNRSTFMKESASSGGKLKKKKAWGWIDIKSIRIKDGPDLTDKLTFIHPDDDNSEDRTVALLPLAHSVQPGESVKIEIEFVTQLPIVYRRNGYYKDFFFVAQWFPKVGVLEDKGWNCHQFHANSEFFSDYGVYDVSLTLPKEYIIGSTGVPQKIVENDSLKTVHIRAEDVHEFAWTAWPLYLIAETVHQGVKIIHLYEKDHQCTVERTLEAMKNTMDYMGDWVGKYPYPRVTVVHPPTGAMNVGGMEYPMLITGGSYWNIPKGIKLTEMVTVHEFGHNWWYGMIGNNEFEEAWLDEGINTYSECRMMDHFYGDETSMLKIPGFSLGELASKRIGYIEIPRRDKILRTAWSYIGGGYGIFSYNKPALMLWTLENYIGRPVMDKIMRTFFQKWKFHHPHTQDFIDVVNQVTGKDYNWFFDQILKGSGDLDFRVATVWTGKETTVAGMFNSDSGKVLLPLEKKEKKDKKETAEKDSLEEKTPEIYKSVVKINRKGEVIIPVDVLLVFENGDSLKYKWDGRERWIKYKIYRPSKLAYAVVDPDRKLVLDINFANNSKTIKHQKGPVDYFTARFIMFFETALQIIGFLG